MSIALRRSWSADLDADRLYELLRLRVDVFVVEQAAAYAELDGRDLLADTRHFWLESATGEILCTLRLMAEDHGGAPGFRIGRVCTRPEARGHGHSARLLRAALAEVGDHPCRVDAQVYLADMYGRLGFVRDGAEFAENGIPHLPMLKR